MKRILMVAGLITMLGLMGACSEQATEEPVDPVEAAWSAMSEAYNEAETAELKVAAFQDFLTEFPESDKVGRLASAIAYYQGSEMEDPQGAFDLLGETLAKNTDPDTRFQIGMAMFPLSVELGQPTDLGAVAEELAASRELNFGEMIDVADTAVDGEQWTVGAEYAEAAMTKATPEAFLADYPDDDYTQQEAEDKAVRRKAMSLADLGWALHNMGDTERAAEVFAEAASYKTLDYLGIADTPVDLYRGKAALTTGDAEQAMELLAPAAVMGSDKDASTALREAYVATKGSEEGFDEWIWSERQKLAKNVDDFSLADYEGNTHEFSTLSNGNVTLLAFWFPT